MHRVAEGAREGPRRFGSPASLAGVLTVPDGVRPRRTALVFLNAGILHRVGPSRMNVWLARRLAADGFPSFRFDVSGLGDSAPRSTRLGFMDRAVDEVRQAMEFLTKEGVAERFVPVGLCSGADLAFEVAVREPRVTGMVSIDGNVFRTRRFWIRHYGTRIVRAESWRNLIARSTGLPSLLSTESASDEPEEGPDRDESAGGEIFGRDVRTREEMTTGFRELVGRGVALLQIFTGGLEERYNYRKQFLHSFPDVDFRDRLTLEFFEDADHTFTSFGGQSSLVRAVRRWSKELPTEDGAAHGGSGRDRRRAVERRG